MNIVSQSGMWRSLVAHYTGGVVVVGSNPAIPTTVVNLIFFLYVRKFLMTVLFLVKFYVLD